MEMVYLYPLWSVLSTLFHKFVFPVFLSQMCVVAVDSFDGRKTKNFFLNLCFLIIQHPVCQLKLHPLQHLRNGKQPCRHFKSRLTDFLRVGDGNINIETVLGFFLLQLQSNTHTQTDTLINPTVSRLHVSLASSEHTVSLGSEAARTCSKEVFCKAAGAWVKEEAGRSPEEGGGASFWSALTFACASGDTQNLLLSPLPKLSPEC